MRYADPAAANGYDSATFKCLMVILDYRSNRFDSLGHSNVGQKYQSRVWNSSQVDQFSKVLVHRDENAIIRSRSFQQGPIAWVRAEGSCLNDVMSFVA